MADSYKRTWWFKSNLSIGVMFLFTTIIIYVIGKFNITPNQQAPWYALLTISVILSVLLIIKGLTDKKPDK